MQATVGMLTYGIFFLFIVFVIKKIHVENISALILFISLSFGILAFFQMPQEASDLTEAFRYLNGIRQTGFKYFQIQHYTIQNYFSGKIGLQIYFYLCSLLPWNNFYSAIAMSLMYFFCLKAIQMAAEYYQLENDKIKNLMILFLFLVDFYDASNGVRNFFAFSIFIYGLALDIYKEKRITGLCLYAVAASIHPSVIALIGLRYIQFLRNRVIRVLIGVVLALWPSGTEGIIALLSPFASINAVNVILGKLSYYSLVNGTTDNFGDTFNTASSYMLMRGFRICLVIIILVVAYRVLKETEKQRTVAVFSQYLCFFSLGTLAPIMATNVFTRYSFAVIMITSMLYAEFLGLSLPQTVVKIGGERWKLSTVILFVVVIAFNYYMFLYHYSSFKIAFELYS